METARPSDGGPVSRGKNFFKSLIGSKNRLAIAIVILAVAGYFIYRHYSTAPGAVRYVLAQASKQTIISSVSGTGQVSQDRTVQLTPPSSGKITSINVKQGQSVKAGQTIAIIDETNNTIALNQARASLASAQASYDSVLAGSTSQNIQLAQLAVKSDQQALDIAKSNLDTVTKQQALAVANALSNYLNSGLEAVAAPNNSGSATIAVTGSYTGTDPGTYQINTYSAGSGVRFQITGLETGDYNITTAPQPIGTKGLYIAFSSNNIAANNSWSIIIPNTQSSSYSSNYNAYQNALTNQTSALASAQNQIVSAQNKLDQDNINLSVIEQPPTDQQLESAKASLTGAQAQFQNAQIAYDNNILKAPFDGSVAQLNNQVGDQATPSTNIATVVTSQSLAIIPLNEVDVANVKLGDKATMTFDAVDGLTITGTVVQIDNIGTVSQGVVTYNVKIAFDTEDPRVKPGMSVNVSVISAVKADVLAVPNSAVQTQGNATFVQTLDPKQTQSDPAQTGVTSSAAPKRTPVQTGLANDSYTEITSGLNEGDTVVAQTITPTAGKSTAASATSLLRGVGGGGGFGGGGAAVARPATTGAAGR